jgi:hypothetical protein
MVPGSTRHAFYGFGLLRKYFPILHRDGSGATEGLVPMSRTPFDLYAKDLTLALLAPFGVAESDARITAETQYADIRFVLSPRKNTREILHDFLTLLLAPRMLFEFAHHPPDLATVVSWLFKRDGWFLALRREAKRKKLPLPTVPPVLCALSAGDPVEAREAYKMHTPVSPGRYEGPPFATFQLIVINQLPKTPETLLVRTMGAGATLRDALIELDALPPDSRMRTIALPRIGQLRIALRNDPSPENKEIIVQAQKIYEKEMKQQLNAGRKAGLKEGLDKGREEGVAEGLRVAILQVCNVRSLKLTAAQQATLAGEARSATLQKWLSRAATATRSNEIFPTP